MPHNESRSKLIELLQKSGLEIINQDLQTVLDNLEVVVTASGKFKEDMEVTIKQLPLAISEEIDEKIDSSVERLIEAAQTSQEHVEELQKQNTELLNKQLNQAQVEFVIAAKDSIDQLFKPQLASISRAKSPWLIAAVASYFLVTGIGIGYVAMSYPLKDISEKASAILQAQENAIEAVLRKEDQEAFTEEFQSQFADLVLGTE